MHHWTKPAPVAPLGRDRSRPILRWGAVPGQQRAKRRTQDMVPADLAARIEGGSLGYK